MGAKVSKNLDSRQNPEIIYSMDEKPKEGSSIIELLKPGCFKAKKTKTNRKRTLEDWLLASPSMKPDCITVGELHVSKQFSKRVHPSSSIEAHKVVLSKAGESFSLERLVILDREADLDCINFSSMDVSSAIKRSKSNETKKRVSFKLPEEADIIIFYSPY
ncbi:uncharacterized protein LOC125370476 [Ricinus communis]|uniref:Uncharacterized protein n=1 Tax=Ricinus communis TaxID=3988 RepID=B9SUD0_RICCO|nr:uncharacterized protein LOC125370476 [Ricinus communis]EEF32791.1 conserved hypothetical protein [Ricinus communis]